MRVYLAASWSRKEEIAKIAKELIAVDIDVQSRWLFEPSVPASRYHFEKFLRERATIDLSDVRAADVLVRFTDDLNCETVPSYLATGSRMFEMGYAYAQGKPIIVVGGHQPVFDYMPNIMHVKDADELLVYLVPSGKIQ